jgi:hypothetical protein
MDSCPEDIAMARILIGQYGAGAKREARRRRFAAAERKSLDDVLRWSLIEETIEELEAPN